MTLETLKNFTFSNLKSFLRIIKPWKKNIFTDPGDISETNNFSYCNGWNDCIKEIQKNADKFFKDFPEYIKKFEAQNKIGE